MYDVLFPHYFCVCYSIVSMNNETTPHMTPSGQPVSAGDPPSARSGASLRTSALQVTIGVHDESCMHGDHSAGNPDRETYMGPPRLAGQTHPHLKPSRILPTGSSRVVYCIMRSLVSVHVSVYVYGMLKDSRYWETAWDSGVHDESCMHGDHSQYITCQVLQCTSMGC